MVRLFKRSSESRGTCPGTMVFVGEKKMEKARIEVMDYDPTDFREWKEATIEDCAAIKDTPAVSWINVIGISDLQVVDQIGKVFDLHPLIMEDIVNTSQRPKMEEFDDYIFIVVKSLVYDPQKDEVQSEQISLVVGKNYVISFQERNGNVFGSMKDRIRASKGRIRRMGSDYLAYSLLDLVVDNYFNVLESLGERIEAIDEEVAAGHLPDAPVRINHLRREILLMRKAVWPMRELINDLDRTESPLLSDEVYHFLMDLYDHTVEMIETIETFRDVLAGFLDLHMSQVSNRMNEVMKTLTMIATIFIPLTFIVGVYGMNFDHMPELSSEIGYPMIWVAMIAMAMVMVLYFRRRKWI